MTEEVTGAGRPAIVRLYGACTEETLRAALAAQAPGLKAGDRIWVTRTRPGAERTAALLRALGYEPVIAPVLEVVQLDPPIPTHMPPPEGAPAGTPGEPFGALAFTSAHAVESFRRLADRDPETHATLLRLPAYAVGPTTAAACRAAGLTVAITGDAGVERLAELIDEAGALDPVLCLVATEPAADLSALLFARGRRGQAMAIYAAKDAGAPVSAAAQLIQSDRAADAVRRTALALSVSPSAGSSPQASTTRM